ncbi:MAG: DNA polymerase-3 subunit gamma/tau [Glaciecola sp.]|jgi:DNA polymerase-3 subunit gamma/tau
MPDVVKIKRSVADVRIPALVSLKELMREDKKQEPNAEDLPKDDYSQEKLTEAWMDFAYTIKKTDLDFFSTLSSFLPEVSEKGTVKITVHNSTQSGDILKMKSELLPSVRKTLNNFSFDFEIEVNKSEAKDIAVTPQQKYAKLVEKNALLEEYRKKLGLGF